MNNAGFALETLYREVGPHLLAYLRRGSGDAHAAEDLLHETFVQATRRPERLAQAASPRAWLFAIARHVLATAWRRRRTELPLPVEPVAAEPPRDDPRLERVQRALTDLPPPLRETLELRLHADLSYDEIAAVLNIPVGTVRSRLHNALRQLRRATTDDATDGTEV